jgi:hypothetical protein
MRMEQLITDGRTSHMECGGGFIENRRDLVCEIPQGLFLATGHFRARGAEVRRPCFVQHGGHALLKAEEAVHRPSQGRENVRVSWGAKVAAKRRVRIVAVGHRATVILISVAGRMPHVSRFW